MNQESINFVAADYVKEIEKHSPALSPKQVKCAGFFAELLQEGNREQNLTRIVGSENFYDGHLLDVIELLKLPSLGKSVLDLGSGCGVPGLLAAGIDTISQRQWHLVESEQSKADFLSNAAAQMGLENVSVYPARVEKVIQTINPETVVARAVGKVDKIANWIWNCSTWNNLVLFKSKGWEEEWNEASKERFGKKLTISHLHEYSSGEKYRVLVTLKRK